jgi:hypothetical protein
VVETFSGSFSVQNDAFGKVTSLKEDQNEMNLSVYGPGGKGFGTGALFEYTLVPQKRDFQEDVREKPIYRDCQGRNFTMSILLCRKM